MCIRDRPKQYVLMESRSQFVKLIKSEFPFPSPLERTERDPYHWESFIEIIEKEKLLVPEKQPLTHIHNSFLVVGNVTNRNNESLIMQWFHCIGNRNWLQRFGRVRMLLWVPLSTASKLMAEPKSKLRSKASVIREAFTDTRLLAISNIAELKKFDKIVLDESNPIVFGEDSMLKGAGVSSATSIALLEINPKNHDLDLENWDYVTKHLMILKQTKLIDALESLGHGAKDYFTEKIEDSTYLNKTPGEMTNDDFIYLTKIFANWPFKPDIYMDFVDILQEESTS